MRDEELKKMLYDSYHTEPSESGKRFIRAYSKRKLSIPTLLLMQLKYMWLQYILILLFLTGVIVYLAVFGKPEYVKVISSLSPFPAIILLAGLGRSAKFRMEELELTTRLSKRMLKSIRLTLSGTAGILAVLIVALTLVLTAGVSVSNAVLISVFPYMITSCACMNLIRRWHANENIFGCIAIAAGVSIFSLTDCINYIYASFHLGEFASFALMILLVIVLIREAYLYVNESEEIQWNLC